MFSKSAKNVFNMVIGPGEFRKTGYFATWWRFVAREHDLTPKLKVSFLGPNTPRKDVMSCLKAIFNFRNFAL